MNDDLLAVNDHAGDITCMMLTVYHSQFTVYRSPFIIRSSFTVENITRNVLPQSDRDLQLSWQDTIQRIHL